MVVSHTNYTKGKDVTVQIMHTTSPWTYVKDQKERRQVNPLLQRTQVSASTFQIANFAIQTTRMKFLQYIYKLDTKFIQDDKENS